MYVDVEDIEMEKLKSDLIEYFMGGVYLDKLAYFGEIDNIEKMDTKDIIKLALNNNFDINKYIKNKTR